MSPTQMGTTLSTPGKRLMIAITDDDPVNFARQGFTPEELQSMYLEGDMNILNFAIDNERIEIVKYLATIASKFPEFKAELINHRFSKDYIQAIH